MTDGFDNICGDHGQSRLVMPGPVQCFRCGECCRRYQVLLEQGEAERLAEYLRLTLSELRMLYTDARWPRQGDYLLLQGETGCPFLRQHGGESLCSIHEIRPRACRDWTAGLDRRECRAGLERNWRLVVNAQGEIEGPADRIKEFKEYLEGASG